MTATVQWLLVGVVHVQDVVHGGADPHWSPPKLKMPSGLKPIESIETERPGGNGTGGIRFTSAHCPAPPSPPALPPIGSEATEIVGAFFFVGCGDSAPLLSGAGVEKDSDGTVPAAVELPGGAGRLVDPAALRLAVPFVGLLVATGLLVAIAVEPALDLELPGGTVPPLETAVLGAAEPLDAELPGAAEPLDAELLGGSEMSLDVASSGPELSVEVLTSLDGAPVGPVASGADFVQPAASTASRSAPATRVVSDSRAVMAILHR